MNKVSVVTSFSPAGWESYGHHFVETFLRHWPSWVRLDVFLEGQQPPFLDDRIYWHELHDDPEHERFCRENAHREDPRDFNMMPVKFGHKVFAVTSPRLPQEGWRVWIDADVVTTADVTQEWLESALPERMALSYLGRTGWMRPGQPMYTECGFVGYHVHAPIVRDILAEMRRIFVSGEVFTLGQFNWHDSYVFDHVRKKLTAPGEEWRWHKLSAHCAAGDFHVWPKTILGQVMLHQKGPRRKMAAYGGVV